MGLRQAFREIDFSYLFVDKDEQKEREKFAEIAVNCHDVYLCELRDLMHRIRVRQWNGNMRSLFKSPEAQARLWGEYFRRNRGEMEMSESRLASIPRAPKLTDKDIEDGYHGVVLFYGFRSLRQSILCGWNEIVQSHPHCRSRRIVFSDNAMEYRDGANPRPNGWFWRKVNLLPKHRSKDRRGSLSVLGDDESMMSFEWFQLFGVTHCHLVEVINEFSRSGALRWMDKAIKGAVSASASPPKRPRFTDMFIGDIELCPLLSEHDNDDEMFRSCPVVIRASWYGNGGISLLSHPLDFVLGEESKCWPLLRK